MNYKEINYKNYGRCLEINNGVIELIVTLDVGPRVIKFAFCGKENLFFEDVDRVFSSEKDEVKEVYGKDAKWYLYGGHRLWVGPEYGYTYYPDNIPIEYSVDANKFTFIQGLQTPFNLQGKTVLTIGEGAEVRVDMFLENKSDKTYEIAPWAITVMKAGGWEVFPMNTNDTGWLSNRTLMLWPYTNLNDDRISFGKEFVLLKQDKEKKTPLKVGMDNNNGWSAYINDGVTFLKKFEYDQNAAYTDNGCNFETYTSEYMTEIESLGKLVKLVPGETASHYEEWKLFDTVPEKCDCPDEMGKRILEIIK
ncbi:MAG: hypothetical protein E7480_03900 [Ruminococcaceae bacterium]|nr:hypothetical protein [Oscillospiraceae bacterium]